MSNPTKKKLFIIMGHCSTKTSVVAHNKYTSGFLKKAIEARSLDLIEAWIAASDPSVLNRSFLPLNKIKLSPLAFALFHGFAEVFELLHLKGASLERMRVELARSGLTPLDVICDRGHQEFLEYYLSHYLQLEAGGPSIVLQHESEEISVFMNTPHTSSPTRVGRSPIHQLCAKGQLKAIQYIINFFQEKPPTELDVHFIDDSGNNGALYSVQSGNLELIRFMHETCRADFQQINKMNENAIVIAAVWSKRLLVNSYSKIFEYLIETLQVDFLHNYEETLLILENPTIIAYIERKLKERGVITSKAVIEAGEKFNCPPASQDSRVCKNFL